LATSEHVDFHKWADSISKIVVPVVLAIFGTIYSCQQADTDQKRLKAQRDSDESRHNFDRDTQLVKMLASSNPDEMKIGMNIILTLAEKNKFTPDLLPAVCSFANDRPGVPLTALAQEVLSKLAAQQKNDQAKTACAGSKSQVKTSNPGSSTIQVYVQIASEEQREDAQRLQVELGKHGFSAQGIELMSESAATRNTYVRFFSAGSESEARKVEEVLNNLGYTKPGIQDFSPSTHPPLPSIEVWIGKSQGRLPPESGS
jgi:hypothetical protein